MKINEVREFNLNEEIPVYTEFRQIATMINWRKTKPNADTVNIQVWKQLLEYEKKEDVKFYFYLDSFSEPCLKIEYEEKSRVLRLPKKGYHFTVSRMFNALFKEL